MPASTRNRHASDDRGVTAVVGTVIVLGITVIGIVAALLFGTPIVQRLQDRSALNTVAGQFQGVAHDSVILATTNSSRSTGLSLPGGTLLLGSGTHVLVTVAYTSTCSNLNITGWTDWGTSTGNVVSLYGCAGTVTAYWTNSTTPLTQDSAGTNATSATMVTTLGLNASDTFDPNKDYLLRIVDGSGNWQADAWLLHMDRLSWRRDTATQVASEVEGGIVFGQELGSSFRVAGPRADEGQNGSSLSLSFPTWQDSRSGAFADNLGHSVFLALASRSVRVDNGTVYKVRLDFHGDLAESWCNAFVARNAALNITSPRYVANSTRPCSPTAPPSDGVRGVDYAMPTGAAFPFRLGQSVIHATLQI